MYNIMMKHQSYDHVLYGLAGGRGEGGGEHGAARPFLQKLINPQQTLFRNASL